MEITFKYLLGLDLSKLSIHALFAFFCFSVVFSMGRFSSSIVEVNFFWNTPTLPQSLFGLFLQRAQSGTLHLLLEKVRSYMGRQGEPYREFCPDEDLSRGSQRHGLGIPVFFSLFIVSGQQVNVYKSDVFKTPFDSNLPPLKLLHKRSHLYTRRRTSMHPMVLSVKGH